MNNDIQETGQHNDHDDASIEQRPLGALRIAGWIIGSLTLLGIAVGTLYVASWYLAGTTDPIQFVTGNLVNALIFIAIVAQVLIYRKQRDIMERQWEAMQDGLRETRRSIEIAQANMFHAQRAYVTVRAGKVITSVHPNWFQMIIENSGNTPAHNVEIFHIVRVLEQPPVPDNNPPGFVGVGVIAPRGAPIVQNADIVNREGEEYRLLQSGQAEVYCWGVVRYKTLGEIRHTRFCFVQKMWALFAPYTSGNEAD